MIVLILPTALAARTHVPLASIMPLTCINKKNRRDQNGGGNHGPDRMVATPREALDDAGANGRWANQCANGHG